MAHLSADDGSGMMMALSTGHHHWSPLRRWHAHSSRADRFLERMRRRAPRRGSDRKRRQRARHLGRECARTLRAKVSGHEYAVSGILGMLHSGRQSGQSGSEPRRGMTTRLHMHTGDAARGGPAACRSSVMGCPYGLCSRGSPDGACFALASCRAQPPHAAGPKMLAQQARRGWQGQSRWTKCAAAAGQLPGKGSPA